MSGPFPGLAGWFQCRADIGDRRANRQRSLVPGQPPASYCAPHPPRIWPHCV